MKVLTIIPIKTKRGEIPADTIIDVPENIISKLNGMIAPLPCETQQDAPQEPTAPPAMVTPAYCQASKTGGRICGSPLREGTNGHLSCSNPVCQVPALHFIGKRGRS